jgi:DNA-binding transcriptional regulator YdaS (Cro superfamily)
MNPDTTYTRTLKRAIEMAGGEAKLAERLGTSPDVLRKWISGELRPPSKVYFAALEIVQVSISELTKRRIPKRGG